MASLDSTNKHPYTERVGALHFTNDATQVTGLLIPTRANHVYYVEVDVLASETADFDEMAGYKRIAAFKNDGGTLTLLGSVAATFTAETTSGWDVTLDASGTNIRVRLTGAASTDISWQIAPRVIEGGWTSYLNTAVEPDVVATGALNG
jgi:hypothetical protein